ncbi:MAG TPA: hypothetical protein VEK08_09975 [Planctomycetota bacterium]|nr:hypothetical protein [Planctomycetota bacterium]
MKDASAVNASILAQLAMLGTEQNRFDDFLLDPQRGTKLMQALLELDPGQTGFRHEDVLAAAQGLCRLSEALLAHLIEKYKGQERIKNLMESGKLLLQLRSGPVIDRKSLNRIIGTFYLDWPYAAHWRRDLYRIPAGNITIMGLIYFGLQKLRDLLDEQTGLA